ncbi:MAG: hypothetical protein DRJ63_08895 [Thermoprotei archaeon]|nr:MAG: hypothetical protein DRJ63_08895 [Thermoprotei archaeon]
MILDTSVIVERIKKKELIREDIVAVIFVNVVKNGLAPPQSHPPGSNPWWSRASSELILVLGIYVFCG